MRPCDEKQRSGHDRQGPGGTSASRTIGQANLAGVNLEPAPDPPRGFNARERRVVDLPRDGRNLTKISATLSIGYKTGRMLFRRLSRSCGHPALIEFAVELREGRDTAQVVRLLPHPKSWRI
jgi:hypothetical protein